MKNTNTRNIILVILGVAILGAVALYFYSPSDRNFEENKETNAVDILPEFGDITAFVKKDLTAEEKEDLKIILEQKKDREIQIKEILDKAYKNGNMEEAWVEVQKIIDGCKTRIDKYIEKKEDFNNYFDKFLEKIESNYVQK